jgi:hypothetical protein
MQLLKARRTGRGFRFVVHLDTTKMLPDGTTPDPAWTLSAAWTTPAQADGETMPAYNARLSTWATGIRADLKAAAVAALADRVEAADEGAALPQEGQTF